MPGRASIVGAAETSVGKVREHNEDSHFIDPDGGIFLVCDGMGGHAAGEVASALAVKTIREKWESNATQSIAEQWLAKGTPELHKQLMKVIHDGAQSAHTAILSEAERDRTKGGMGTTLVGAIVVGGDIVFAHCGDSRAYLVRDGIAMQLTEDHTLLARLLAAGVDVDVNGDGARFKSMLTNALGIGEECKVSTFVVPLADGDRFLLCSDGITEYVAEAEIGEVLCKQPSPARSAQRLVELALARGGGDNATALVVRVLEAGETSRPAEQLKKDQSAIEACPLWGEKITPQQRLRALRIALPREYASGERVPAQTLGDRVAWILLDGEVEQDAVTHGPGALLYPEALLADRPLPDKDGLAKAKGELRALAIRADDFRELCEDDPEIGEALLEALAEELGKRHPTTRRTGKLATSFDVDARGSTDPGATARAVTKPGEDGEEPASEMTIEADEPPEAKAPEAEESDEPEMRVMEADEPPPEELAAREAEAAPERVIEADEPGSEAVAEQPVEEHVIEPDEPEPAAPPVVVEPGKTKPLGSPAPRAGTPLPLPPPPEPPSRPSGPRLGANRPSSERLVLQADERAAAANDLEDALTKLTVDGGWDEGEPEAADDKPKKKPKNHELSEPEISIVADDPNDVN